MDSMEKPLSLMHSMEKPPWLTYSIEKNDAKRFRTELLHRVDEILVIFFDPILPEHGGIRRLPKRDIRFMRPPANTHLATFLIGMFSPNFYLDDTYFDTVKESPAEFHSPGTLTGDIHEVMRL